MHRSRPAWRKRWRVVDKQEALEHQVAAEAVLDSVDDLAPRTVKHLSLHVVRKARPAEQHTAADEHQLIC
jgi:hypothetical protein